MYILLEREPKEKKVIQKKETDRRAVSGPAYLPGAENTRRSNSSVIQCCWDEGSNDPHPGFLPRGYVGVFREDATYGRWPDRGESHSEVLRQSLIAANVPDPSEGYISNQAHHIVEVSNKLGNAILNAVGIHLNSAANGVFLPECEGDNTGNATIHKGSHNQEYTNCVNNVLLAAIMHYDSQGYKAAVCFGLNDIRTLLLNSSIPINRKVDVTLNRGTGKLEDIKQIFCSQFKDLELCSDDEIWNILFGQ